MTIDNKFRTAQTKILFMVLLGLFIIFLVLSQVEYEKYQIYYLSASVFFLTLYFLMHLINLNYFYLNDDKNKITIRYYYAHPVIRKYKAFEIQKNIISGYVINKTLLGLKKELIIKVSSSKGSGSYPPISISLLNRDETNKLEKILNQQIRENKIS